MGEDDCIKIGDFGLSRTEAAIEATGATEDQTATAATLNPAEAAAIIPLRPRRGSGSEDHHTTGVGTASYASPEQLQGRHYGVRSDLFSLGLILLELCCCFTTTHERADAFQSMRHPEGTAPPHLAALSPAIARLAEDLCRTFPERRPSTAEVAERLNALNGSCGCEDCPGNQGRDGDVGGGWRFSSGGYGSGPESEEPGEVRLREELAAKTRKVEQQVHLVC